MAKKKKSKEPAAPEQISYEQLMAQSRGEAENQFAAQAAAQSQSYNDMMRSQLTAVGDIAANLNNEATAEGWRLLGMGATSATNMGRSAGSLGELGAQARTAAGTMDPAQARINELALAGRDPRLVGAAQVGPVADVNGRNVRASVAERGMMQQVGGGQGTILGQLEGQAANELAMGRALSPEQQRAATQQARGAFAARGMVTGNPAASAEILNRDAFATAREAERRNFAGNVAGLGTQMRGAADGMYAQRTQANAARNMQGQLANQQVGLARASQNAGFRQQSALANQAADFAQQGLNQQQLATAAGLNYGREAGMLGLSGNLYDAQGRQFAAQSALLNQAAMSYANMDPYQRALQSNLPGQVLQGSLAMGSMAGDSFNRNAQLAGQVAGFNQNMQGSLYNSWQNNQAGLAGAQMQAGATQAAGNDAMTGQLMSTLGTGAAAAGTAAAGAIAAGAGATAVGGGAAAAAASAAVAGAVCWVAREAFGEQDGRWRGFRSWLLRRAPRWFLRAYARHGERVAEWLRGNAWAKPAVRFCMQRAMKGAMA